MRKDMNLWLRKYVQRHRAVLVISCMVGVFLILPFGLRSMWATGKRPALEKTAEDIVRETVAAQITAESSETPSVSAFMLRASSAGWQQTAAGWIYLNASGERETGTWIVGEDGRYYYVNAAGIMEYGEILRIDGERYHFAADGSMSTGRFYQGEYEYFASPSGALYRNSWVQDGENWCYVDGLGRIVKGGMTPDSYYVDEHGYLVAAPGSRFEGFTYENDGAHRLYLNLGTADIIHSYLKSHGWTETAIAGLLGNFQQESGINPGLEEAGSHNGYGLGQWSFERRVRLEAYCRERNKPYDDLLTQLEFLLQEPGESEFVARYARTDWSSPAAAAIEWGISWERYNLADLSMSRVRIPYAEAYYAHYVHGVSFLVSSTKYEEPKALMEVASAANAEAKTASTETEAPVEQSGETVPAEESASSAETKAENKAESSSAAALEEDDRRKIGFTSGGGSGSVVRKVRAVTSFETEEDHGPGFREDEQTTSAETESKE